MHSSRLLPLAMLLPAVLSSCEKEDAPPGQTVLRGSWAWRSSFCGWSGANSPATTGTTEELLFDPLGRVHVYRNGVLQSNTRYTLSRHPSLLTEAPADFVRFGDQEYRYEIQGSTLTLSADISNGCNSAYGRTAH